MIEGESVSHDFVIQNISGEPIELLSDADIHLTCGGCSSLAPADRRIEPGAQTVVKARLETRGKRGPFAKGGTMVWTSVSGVKRQIGFVLEGEAVPPIESNPEVVRFDANEMRKGQGKELVLRANVPVEWGSLKWSSSSPQFHLLESRIEGSSVRCRVKCVLAEGQESLQGVLTGYVNGGEKSQSPHTFSIPFLAEQTVDLIIVPKTVPIMLSSSDGKGQARLLLHGELLGRDEPYIREIRCEGFRVKWSASKPTASKKAVLEIAFEPSAKRRESDLKIQIELLTGKTIVLPAVLVRSRMVRD